MVKKVKATSLENDLRRALADYANLEKRVNREKAAFAKFANAVLIEKVLAALDGLERAEKHLQDKGLTLALGQLKTALLSEGVEEIEVKGKEFDVNEMDCVEVIEGKKNRVAEIVNKGYKLNGRVLRPAKVKIGTKNG